MIFLLCIQSSLSVLFCFGILSLSSSLSITLFPLFYLYQIGDELLGIGNIFLWKRTRKFFCLINHLKVAITIELSVEILPYVDYFVIINFISSFLLFGQL